MKNTMTIREHITGMTKEEHQALEEWMARQTADWKQEYQGVLAVFSGMSKDQIKQKYKDWLNLDIPFGIAEQIALLKQGY